MSNFTHKWLTISFLNLLFVAVLGIILRYKIAFYLPFVEQKFALHSHSHFAFSGWITQTFMVLMIHHLAAKAGPQVLKKYRFLLYGNLITAYGMLVSFFIQGYGAYSITFSTLSIFISYAFALLYWMDLNRQHVKLVSHLWLKAALAFSVFSSLGFFCLAYMMANKIVDQNAYLACIYFFLHFQYNGWFLFAGMGLLVSSLEKVNKSTKLLRLVFLLFCSACVPAYLLSVMWMQVQGITYMAALAATAQLLAWGLLVRFLIQNRDFIHTEFSKQGKVLLFLSAIAFSIKLVLQFASVHPALSQLSYSFRPVIIGYLHLVLLAVTSIFITGYIVSFRLVPVTKRFKQGVFIFVAGIIINELFLLVQSIAAISYNSIPYIDMMLFAAALILFAGISLMFSSCLRTKDESSAI